MKDKPMKLEDILGYAIWENDEFKSPYLDGFDSSVCWLYVMWRSTFELVYVLI